MTIGFSSQSVFAIFLSLYIYDHLRAGTTKKTAVSTALSNRREELLLEEILSLLLARQELIYRAGAEDTLLARVVGMALRAGLDLHLAMVSTASHECVSARAKNFDEVGRGVDTFLHKKNFRGTKLSAIIIRVF